MSLFSPCYSLCVCMCVCVRCAGQCVASGRWDVECQGSPRGSFRYKSSLALSVVCSGSLPARTAPLPHAGLPAVTLSHSSAAALSSFLLLALHFCFTHISLRFLSQAEYLSPWYQPPLSLLYLYPSSFLSLIFSLISTLHIHHCIPLLSQPLDSYLLLILLSYTLFDLHSYPFLFFLGYHLYLTHIIKFPFLFIYFPFLFLNPFPYPFQSVVSPTIFYSCQFLCPVLLIFLLPFLLPLFTRALPCLISLLPLPLDSVPLIHTSFSCT